MICLFAKPCKKRFSAAEEFLKMPGQRVQNKKTFPVGKERPAVNYHT